MTLELRWRDSSLLSRRWFWAVSVAAVLGVALLAHVSRDDEDRIEQMRRAGDVAGLGRIAKDANKADATRAVEALGSLGDGAVEALLVACEDPRPAVREQSVLSLGTATHLDHAQKLVGILKTDSSPQVRAAAARTLGQNYACKQMPDLIDALEDTDPTVRASVHWSVARIMGIRFGLKPNDPPGKRREAMENYRDLWRTLGKQITKFHNER